MPVNHSYNLLNYIVKNGIIDNDSPKIDKWCNFKNINVTKYNLLDETKKKELTIFIKKYYMQSDKVKFIPDKNNIF